MEKSDEKEYEDFIASLPSALFFHTIKYKSILETVLESSQAHYFIARGEDGKIVGVLPTFVMISSRKECVANSLPFFGSHGGVLCHSPNIELKRILLSHQKEFLSERGCSSSTIITTPYEQEDSVYLNLSENVVTDVRIGQISIIPTIKVDAPREVMESLPSKTRNMVRKAEKYGCVVKSEKWMGSMDFVARTHQQNMAELGGKEKPKTFFDSISANCSYGKDYKIFTAWRNGEPISGLLLFYYKQWVEYFTPVVIGKFRNLQPLSLLIYHALIDAACQGYRYWNWGGTWLSQKGVYDFKHHWGAYDRIYKYYTVVYDNKIMTYPPDVIARDFPYYFVYPFVPQIR